MMNKSHGKQGICGVVVIGSALAAAQVPLGGYIGTFALGAALMVGGSIFPDIDSEGSHPTKSFGWLSHLVHSITHLLTQALYNASLGRRDRKKKGSHRLLTHTALGNILAGAVLTGLCYIHPAVAAVVVGFLVAMAMSVWRKRWKWITWLIAGVAAYGMYDPRMIWIWGVAFAIGNMIHCFGDSCTLSGTPWFWPMEKEGKRWGASHALPKHLRIRTGTNNEKILMGMTYGFTLAACAAMMYVGSLIF